LDVLTHTLVALLLARLLATPALGRRRAAWMAVACANLPELDQFLRLSSTQTYLLHRCGPTHSLLFWGLGTLATVSVLRRVAEPGTPGHAPWLASLWLGLLAMGFHLALAALTSHGAALLWPATPRRFALDWVFPNDPVPALLCLAGLAAPLWGASPRRSPAVGVLALGLYMGLLGGAHGLARNQAAAMARKEGFELDGVWAFPETPGGLFWNTVAANEAEVLQRPVDLGRAPRSGFRYYRGLEEPLVEDFLENTDLGRLWNARARVTVASSDRSATGADNLQGWEVWVRDLAWFSRFSAPERVTPYDVRARFDQNAELLEATLFMPTRLPDEPPPFPVHARAVSRPAPRTGPPAAGSVKDGR
jgi:membrane-bound metal-dependent hydrolase YbcI (DUF457 family)